jgi:hypothetical protein
MIKMIRPLLGISVAVVSACLCSGPVSAGNVPSMQSDYTARYEPLLKSTPALELPARSASLVSAAKLGQKEPAALAIVNVVSKINPSALPPVVGAISKAEPSLSAKVASEAGRLQPKLTSEIKTAIIVTTADPVPGVPNPDPTNGNGKKKGHYKNP